MKDTLILNVRGSTSRILLLIFKYKIFIYRKFVFVLFVLVGICIYKRYSFVLGNNDRKKEKRLLLIKQGLFLLDTYNVKKQKNIELPIRWDKLVKEAISNVNKEYPDLADIKVNYKPQSFKSAVYKYKKEGFENQIKSEVSGVDLVVSSSPISTFRATFKSNPDLKMFILIARSTWFEAVNAGQNKAEAILRCQDILLAIGTLICYDETTQLIKWPEKGSVSFSWGIYLDALKEIKAVKSFSLDQKKLAQRDFFNFINTTETIESGKSVFYTNLLSVLAPNWRIRFSDLITLEMKQGNTLIPNTINLEIIFTRLTGKTPKQLKSVFLLSNICNSIRNEKVFSNLAKNVAIYPILLGVKGLLQHIRASSIGVTGFKFKAIYIPLLHFCNVICYESEFKARNFLRIKERIMRIKLVFELFNFGRIFLPVNISSSSLIFIEVNPECFKSDDFKLFDNKWLKLSSLEIYQKEKDIKLNSEEIYQMLKEKVFLETKKNRMFKFNIFDETFPTLVTADSIAEEDVKNTIILINNQIPVLRSMVYTSKTYLQNPQPVSQSVFLKVSSLITITSKALEPIERVLNNLPRIEKILLQKENLSLSNLLHSSIQTQVFKIINEYFPKIEDIFSIHEPKEFYINFFKNKLDLLKINVKNPSAYLNWANTNPYFSGIFPKGYYFPSNKFYIDKESKPSFDISFNDTRLEEIRKTTVLSNGKEVSGSVISMKKIFRKDFQANAAASMGLVALDLDAKSMHGNIVSVVLGNQLEIDWDKIYSNLVSFVQKDSILYTENLLMSLGINRDSLKEHVLAILNGRSTTVPYSVPFPDAFSKEHMTVPHFNKLTKKKEIISKYNYLVNVLVKKFFNENCEFVQAALQFRKKVKEMKYFFGFSFPDIFTLDKKVNFILQCYESLVTISLIIDILKNQMILHSIERDGIVVFSTVKQLSSLQFKTFEKVNESLLNGNIKISCKYLVKEGEKPPFDQLDLDKINLFSINTPISLLEVDSFANKVNASPLEKEVSSDLEQKEVEDFISQPLPLMPLNSFQLIYAYGPPVYFYQYGYLCPVYSSSVGEVYLSELEEGEQKFPFLVFQGYVPPSMVPPSILSKFMSQPWLHLDLSEVRLVFSEEPVYPSTAQPGFPQVPAYPVDPFKVQPGFP